MRSSSPILTVLLAICVTASMTLGATTHKKKRRSSAQKSNVAAKSPAAKKSVAAAKTTHAKALAAASHTPLSHAARLRASRKRWSPWTEPTYADSTDGDFIDGEDLTVRRAAVEALAGLNGSVLVVDPSNGRILTMVNQKLALKSGFQPCSTIKIYAALAGLSEGTIERNTLIHLYGRKSMSLDEAITHSNNPYFAAVGTKLGFERVSYYARLYGLGEKAGWNVPGEQPGVFPDRVAPEGLGMMTSFGSGISLTPLQLASMISAIANGGTLHYLQYPRSIPEAENLVPRVKRHLDIAQWLPEIRPGMAGAVESGTARRASLDQDSPIFGKTGTCTDSKSPVHLGWFGSFNEVGKKKLVVVVLLTGGRGVSGPIASGVAGGVYRNLAKENYYQQDHRTSPVALMESPTCCAIKVGNE